MPPIDGPTQYTWHTENTEHTGDPEDAQTKVCAFISIELGDFKQHKPRQQRTFQIKVINLREKLVLVKEGYFQFSRQSSKGIHIFNSWSAEIKDHVGNKVLGSTKLNVCTKFTEKQLLRYEINPALYVSFLFFQSLSAFSSILITKSNFV